MGVGRKGPRQESADIRRALGAQSLGVVLLSKMGGHETQASCLPTWQTENGKIQLMGNRTAGRLTCI